MDDILPNCAAPGLLDALEANMVAFWRAYGAALGCEVTEGPELTRVVTGMPVALFNGVYRARLSDDAAAAAIEETRQAVARRQAPLLWWVAPGSQPAGLVDLLVAHGFTPAGSVPGMAVDLARLAPAPPLPPGFRIEVVQDRTALAQWSEVAGLGTGFPAPAVARLIELDQGIGLFPATVVQRYLGLLDGVAVAASARVDHAGVTSPYAVATLPAARRRGIGAAMTVQPLRDAAAAGYRVGTLQASEMGYGVYHALGFAEVCRIELYLLRP